MSFAYLGAGIYILAIEIVLAISILFRALTGMSLGTLIKMIIEYKRYGGNVLKNYLR